MAERQKEKRSPRRLKVSAPFSVKRAEAGARARAKDKTVAVANKLPATVSKKTDQDQEPCTGLVVTGESELGAWQKRVDTASGSQVGTTGAFTECSRSRRTVAW